VKVSVFELSDSEISGYFLDSTILYKAPSSSMNNNASAYVTLTTIPS